MPDTLAKLAALYRTLASEEVAMAKMASRMKLAPGTMRRPMSIGSSPMLRRTSHLHEASGSAAAMRIADGAFV